MTKDQTKPRYAKKAPTRGGARANAGRKKGSTTKITVESLMEQIEIHSGKSFAEVLPFQEMIGMAYVIMIKPL